MSFFGGSGFRHAQYTGRLVEALNVPLLTIPNVRAFSVVIITELNFVGNAQIWALRRDGVPDWTGIGLATLYSTQGPWTQIPFAFQPVPSFPYPLTLFVENVGLNTPDGSYTVYIDYA